MRYNDTVVLRGMDTYRNLPNKTLRLMRYVLAHPAGACGAMLWECFCMCPPVRAAAALLCALPGPQAARRESCACTSLLLLHPAGYTHVLKTDDDCYVRIPKILEALQTPPEEPSASALPPQHLMAGGAAAASGDGAAAPRLTGVRQGLREWMARDGGHPLHTDGINVYNATALVASASAGGTAGGLSWAGLGWGGLGRQMARLISICTLAGAVCTGQRIEVQCSPKPPFAVPCYANCRQQIFR